jgi:hypothetical protein
MAGYADQGGAGAFERSRAVFESVVAELTAAESGPLTHAELEERLTERSRELMRQLYQDHLDLRTAREQRRTDVVGGDGLVRTRVENAHRRQLTTVFGQVSVDRLAYRALGAPNLYPADAVLNLPVEKHSHGLRRLTAVEAVRGSFEQAQAAVEQASGVSVGKRQVETLAQAAATDIEVFYAGRRPDPSPVDTLLVMQVDGKGIVMRPEALREATAKAARVARQKLATRLSPGEKTGRKRMAELAAVYDAAPVPRTAADIIAGPRPDTTAPAERRRGPIATGKWLTASVTSDIPAVVRAGFDEAQRRDPDHRRTWVVLVDGNRTQIQAIHAEATTRGVSTHLVLDFIHVLQYLWKAAWSFFYPGDRDAQTWVADQAIKILQGNPGQVAAGLRRRATRFGYSPTERAGADTCAAYLTSNKPYLDYATALAAGWPIATGVIEGACRHLIKDRMDITGARWGLAGAEAVLKLRALTANGDFDTYWAFHLQQEHQRVHQSRYLPYRDDLTLAA